MAGCLSAQPGPGRSFSTLRAVAGVVASAVVAFGAGQAIDGAWPAAWEGAVLDSVFIGSTVYGLRGFGCIAQPAHVTCEPPALVAFWIGVLGFIGSRAWQVYESAAAPGRRHHAIVRALQRGDASGP